MGRYGGSVRCGGRERRGARCRPPSVRTLPRRPYRIPPTLPHPQSRHHSRHDGGRVPRQRGVQHAVHAGGRKHVGLARARKASDGLAAAAAVLEQAVALDDGDVWNEAGAVAFERRRFVEAVAFFDRALAKNPGSTVYRSNRDRAQAAADFLSAAGILAPRD